MRLVGAELLKLVTAYRTILGIVLAQTAIVLLGTIVTVYDVANDPALPQNFGRDLVGIAARPCSSRRSWVCWIGRRPSIGTGRSR